jgi:hypothetical protein
MFVLAARRDAPQLLVKVNARKVPVYSVMIGSLAGFLGILAATEARRLSAGASGLGIRSHHPPSRFSEFPVSPLH